MYIDKLKRKYQQILHGTSGKDQNSQNQNSLTSKSTCKIDKKTKFLTEYSENTHQTNTCYTSPSYILALKERVAQATHNFKEKQGQCVKLGEQMIKKDERIRLLQLQLADAKTCIENSQKKVVEAKVVSAELEKNIQILHNQLQAYAIDRELAMKQAQFFKKQSSKMKKQKKNTYKSIPSSQKYQQQIELVCNQNSRLKQDVKRMQVVINQMSQDKQLVNLADKHYLGKAMKQSTSWFPMNLIGEVQHFLKKEQIVHGNKQFLNNLVKFISKYASSVSKSSTKVSEANSRVKQVKNSHCRSISLCQQGHSSYYDDHGTSFIRKTQGIGISVLKKSLLLEKYKKYHSRKYTAESLMHAEREGEGTATCQQILSEYKKVLKQALGERQIKQNVILGLTEQMSSAITELFETQVN